MNNFGLKTSDFDYDLPQELIAQYPTDKRDHSRLMVLNRKNQTIEHKLFKDIVDYLFPGDVLVLNDTKVMPANIIGRKADGTAKIEVLLVKPLTPLSPSPLVRGKGIGERGLNIWTCLVKPGKRLKVGSEIIFSGDLKGKVLEKLESGEQVIEFDGNLQGFMRKHGEIPLPPYITSNRKHQTSNLNQRYQTVYAENEGASAAPTAGLHFTPELLDKIKNKGIKVAKITLHTGLGTFKPVYAEYIKDHKMFEEEFTISEDARRVMRDAGRVVAVGTTSVRALETVYPLCPSPLRQAQGSGHLPLNKGEKKRGLIHGFTDIFIYPGFKFKIVDLMVTNFHIPKSTLLMLVSAFAGKDFIMRAYKEAIDMKYRFFSFGDAMVIL